MGLTRRAASRHKSTSRWRVGRLAWKVESFFPVAAAGLTGRLIDDLIIKVPFIVS
jgi:hypothetical protein